MLVFCLFCPDFWSFNTGEFENPDFVEASEKVAAKEQRRIDYLSWNIYTWNSNVAVVESMCFLPNFGQFGYTITFHQLEGKSVSYSFYPPWCLECGAWNDSPGGIIRGTELIFQKSRSGGLFEGGINRGNAVFKLPTVYRCSKFNFRHSTSKLEETMWSECKWKFRQD